MPTLIWQGKDKILNHHLDVPFRVLEPQYTVGIPPDEGDNRSDGPRDDGPRIIHGDNLEALKALLPHYEGRVKCIYIDPPYNTGNEGWIYNDNVSDPKLKRWLGRVVGKESEDLSRHDKWLCMMYPRLVLLHKLLASDGAIFISIDDNEQASLKLIMDEIWGTGNFVANIAWEKSDSPRMDAKYFSIRHEYLHLYAKSKGFFQLSRGAGGEVVIPSHYDKTDKDGRIYYTKPLRAMGGQGDSRISRPNLYYGLEAPDESIIFPIKQNGEDGAWRWSKEKYANEIEKIEWVNGRNGWIPYYRIYAENIGSRPPETLWNHSEVGSNRTSKAEVNAIFGQSNPFDTPKPTKLLERIIQLSTGPNDIILDSFAGSGTTAHAVLNLNKQDGGNRKFILVEMEDYAETITAERVRRVINGYADKPGTGGSFTYYELGETLFTEDGLLNENLPVDRIREYVWYSETRTALPPSVRTQTEEDTPHFLGKLDDTAYYFYYEPNALTTLDYEFLTTVRTLAGQYVMYADNCLIAREWLQERRIIFKKIPRDISRL